MKRDAFLNTPAAWTRAGRESINSSRYASAIERPAPKRIDRHVIVMCALFAGVMLAIYAGVI